MTIQTLTGVASQLLPETSGIVLLNGFDRRGLVVVTRDGVDRTARFQRLQRPTGCDVRAMGRRRRHRGGWPARVWPIPRVSAWRLARRTR
ncbi:hypothetical protein ACFPIJ_09840 [Dactylosporangium cerinum]|uniref:Uncharacterized protein n=1 Tax=Dactylosporangium cerinum TaxID=1434730 RepID=A0ABV9VQ64_9ACTN